MYGEPQALPQEALPQLIEQFIKQQQFNNNPFLHRAPMCIPHKCKDGNAGLAQFSGFMKEK